MTDTTKKTPELNLLPILPIKRETHLFCNVCGECQSSYANTVCDKCKIILNNDNKKYK
jgi:predicted nucleic acid-binding Zn ribbon protein